MNLNTCIQESYTVRYQNLALRDLTDNTKNFFNKRVNGVVKVPFASLADAFISLYHCLCEVKLAITDRANYKQHLNNAINHIALAVLWFANIGASPFVNIINPEIYNAFQTPTAPLSTIDNSAAHDAEILRLTTAHEQALESMRLLHASVLDSKENEIASIRENHVHNIRQNDAAHNQQIQNLKESHAQEFTNLLNINNQAIHGLEDKNRTLTSEIEGLKKIIDDLKLENLRKLTGIQPHIFEKFSPKKKAALTRISTDTPPKPMAARSLFGLKEV